MREVTLQELDNFARAVNRFTKQTAQQLPALKEEAESLCSAVSDLCFALSKEEVSSQ